MPIYLSLKNIHYFTYNIFNLTHTINEAGKRYEIEYYPNQQRAMTIYTVNNTEQEKKIYCGREYEHNLTTNTQYNYIYVGDMPIALYVQGDTNAMYTLHTNYIGSIEKISDKNGNVVDSMSYTPFGQRRMFSDWSKTDTATHFIDRGFTGQQHLDNFALINFNGRMYDPVLAHFLSPDPYIQSPKNPLNYNRYSYCLFSPLQYVDPSGLLISTHVDKDGNVIETYNDGNLGIYVHSDKEINDYKTKGIRLENNYDNLIGVTLCEKSFKKGDKIDLGSNQAEQWLKTFESSVAHAWVNPISSLLVYVMNAGNGDVFDAKSKLSNGSQISEGVYVSPRDLGNFAAGLFGKLLGLPKERTLASFGAFQLAGNNKKEFLNSYSKYYNQALGTMGIGLVPSQKTYGEKGISNYFQRLGYENIKTLEDFNRRYSDIWK
ncbi:MAG: RHS repeat-associated core domain-containing protein [Bacteroidales bacterium]|nr:RHS repeat-associated core domain-containing protein [Bacteroidales bacterium]